MALASNSKSYTPTAAIKEMEGRMAAFPKRWAEEGDEVLMDWGVGYTALQARHPDSPLVPTPWGWSMAMKYRLLRWGVPSHLLPADETLAAWRDLSSRRFATDYLRTLLESPCLAGYKGRLAGEGCRFFTSAEELLRDTREITSAGHEAEPAEETGLRRELEERGAEESKKVIFKSPWSSSGRGVFVTDDMERAKARIAGYVRRQGGFVADIYYNKVLDCALEFSLSANGRVSFLGYSVFLTDENGRYRNHYVEGQASLRRRIVSALDFPAAGELLDALVAYHRLALGEQLGGRYWGPLGIDMMVCDAGGRHSLHPCLEINLRMNMGIVAILLHRRNPDAPPSLLF